MSTHKICLSAKIAKKKKNFFFNIALSGLVNIIRLSNKPVTKLVNHNYFLGLLKVLP